MTQRTQAQLNDTAYSHGYRQGQAATIAELPKVENTEIWMKMKDPSTPGPRPSAPLPDPVQYDMRTDGSAVIPANQLRSLLIRSGYDFAHTIERKS